jgi:hypothetical protein
VEEQVNDAQVAAFRRQVGVKELDDLNVLAVDFGSTFTKVLTFNTKDEKVKLRYVPTIVEDIRHSLANGLGIGDEVKKSGSLTSSSLVPALRVG